MWLILLGWYLARAAHAEATYLLLRRDLQGIPAGRLMSAPPVCGFTGQSVADFLARVGETPDRGAVVDTHPGRC